MTKQFTVASKFTEHLKTAGVVAPTKPAAQEQKVASAPADVSVGLDKVAGLMYKDPVLARYIDIGDLALATDLATGRYATPEQAAKLASMSREAFSDLAVSGLRKLYFENRLAAG